MPLGPTSLDSGFRRNDDYGPGCFVTGQDRGTKPPFHPSSAGMTVRSRWTSLPLGAKDVVMAKVDQGARDKGITTTQLALAWLMAQGSDIILIPSSKSRDHLEENLKAVAVELTDEDLRRLEAILPYGTAAGNRTRDMKRVNV